MRKINKLIAIMLTMFLVVFGFGACKTPEIPNDDDGHMEQIDTNKTQLYVYNYNAGYKSEWLYKAKERYEKVNADKSWEEGKKGEIGRAHV